MKYEIIKNKSVYVVRIIILIILIIVGVLFIIVNKKTPKKQLNKESKIQEQQKNVLNEENTSLEQQKNVLNEENTSLEQQKNVLNEESNELFAKYYEKAEKLLKTMTLEEKVGQMFLVSFQKNEVIEQIKKYNPGGYILFARDFENETKNSILKKLQECQNVSKINLIFGVDEEGGEVVRVSRYSAFRKSKFLSPQQLWDKGKLLAILQDSTEKSTLLKSIGLNMNLAPVADVPTKTSSFIYKRAFGVEAEKTAIYVSNLIKTMNNDGMISVMKHFPGYGDNADTHKGSAIDKREYSIFEKSDFLPFISGIEAEAPCILVSHNIVTSMDKKNPASLSKNVHNILRNELKFSGIIMTDDLAMDAVDSYAEKGEAAIQAILAGNDIIITSNFIKQKQEILNAVKLGKISEKQIDEAVKRILAWKYNYNIIS